MKITTFINTLALVASTIVLFTAQGVKSLTTDMKLVQAAQIPEGYALSPVQWTGNIHGITVNHTGTIEELTAQLEVDHPELKSALAAETYSGEVLDKRFMTDLNCIPVGGQNWGLTDATAILEGTRYLRNKDVVVWLPPHHCGRISCSYSAAIYACNDNDDSVPQASRSLGDYADALCRKCLVRGNLCGGQAWDNGKWNVNVYWDRC